MVRRVVRPTREGIHPGQELHEEDGLLRRPAPRSLVWYLVAVMFGDSSLGRTGGWVLVTFNDMMVVVGGVDCSSQEEAQADHAGKTPERNLNRMC